MNDEKNNLQGGINFFNPFKFLYLLLILTQIK